MFPQKKVESFQAANSSVVSSACRFFLAQGAKVFSPPFLFLKGHGEDIFVEAELSFLETHFEDSLH